MKKILFAFFLSMLLISKGYSQIIIDTADFVKNNRQLYAIVVSQNNRTIYKQFFNGKSKEDIFNNQCVTKSVVSLLIGIAIDKGYIPSLDQKIGRYFSELKSDPDKRKQNITIRQIMNQASGLWHENVDDLDVYYNLANPDNYVLKANLVSQPGSVFHYNNAASHLLSIIITESTGMNTLQFANKYLFGPLAIKDVKWDKLNDGYYDGCGLLSVHLLTEDMNKIGALLLGGGIYNNKRIVSQKWTNQILHSPVFYSTEWGFPGSTYSMCWYHCNYKGTPVTYSFGWDGQFLFVIPDKKAVIAVNEIVDHATGTQAQHLFLNKIFPLIYQQLQ